MEVRVAAIPVHTIRTIITTTIPTRTPTVIIQTVIITEAAVSVLVRADRRAEASEAIVEVSPAETAQVAEVADIADADLPSGIQALYQNYN